MGLLQGGYHSPAPYGDQLTGGGVHGGGGHRGGEGVLGDHAPCRLPYRHHHIQVLVKVGHLAVTWGEGDGPAECTRDVAVLVRPLGV